MGDGFAVYNYKSLIKMHMIVMLNVFFLFVCFFSLFLVLFVSPGKVKFCPVVYAQLDCVCYREEMI